MVLQSSAIRVPSRRRWLEDNRRSQVSTARKIFIDRHRRTGNKETEIEEEIDEVGPRRNTSRSEDTFCKLFLLDTRPDRLVN